LLPKIGIVILFLALICGGELKMYYFVTLSKNRNVLLKKGAKKHVSEPERKVSIYKKHKKAGFCPNEPTDHWRQICGTDGPLGNTQSTLSLTRTLNQCEQ